MKTITRVLAIAFATMLPVAAFAQNKAPTPAEKPAAGDKAAPDATKKPHAAKHPKKDGAAMPADKDKMPADKDKMPADKMAPAEKAK
jgi:hypothetical protein